GEWEGRGVRPADRDALGTQRDHPDDLRVREANPDRVLEGELPDLPRLGIVRGSRLGDLGQLHRQVAEELGLLDLFVLLSNRPQWLVRNLFRFGTIQEPLTAGP